MKRHLKFFGVDGFNRPVFKVVETGNFIGSTEKLFGQDTPEKNIVEYFRNNISSLCYFGGKFGCEPEGYKLREDIEFILQLTNKTN